MKVNNFGYLVKEGFRGIFSHGLPSFAAVCVTVACLLIVGSFSVLMYNVGIMVEELNKTNEILVYIDAELPDADARSVGTQINRIENVQNSVFVSREEALEAFVAEHQGDSAFSGVEATDLRHRYVVTLMDNTKMAETVVDIEEISGVANISAAYELAEGFSTIQSVVRIASIAVIVALLFVSLLIISNTVKMAMSDRKDEIGIMKMVGATNGFISFPYLVEGFVLGIFSAAVAFGLQWLLYDLLVARLAAVDTLQLFSFVPFTRLLTPMIITFTAAGLFVGIVGSLNSVRKFMDV
ncbi:MAG: permease-like cell division protein FtsX [Oscillospiraceae bacterium]|nr:permease-like cell division protein FtsX [Oscillospiraceae bacterium]